MFIFKSELIMVEIKGFMKTSMLDYPEKIASMIFLPGCNFRCPYCHNQELVDDDPRLVPFGIDIILDYLKKKKNWIDGIVISGGEPTLHNDLPELIKKFKNLGFAVKLDTNGTNPEMVKKLIDNRLIDYVAMDIKSSKEKYDKAAGVKVNMKNIEKSIDILRNSDIDYEFRTTVVPGIVTEEDIIKIGKLIKGAKAFYIQQFVPVKTIDDSYMKINSYLNPVLDKMKELASDYVEKCEIRGT